MCLCVYVRKTLKAGSLVVLSTRQCRLLLNKYGLRVSLLGNSTLGWAHTHRHTGLLCMYVPLLIQWRHVDRHLYCYWSMMEGIDQPVSCYWRVDAPLFINLDDEWCIFSMTDVLLDWIMDSEFSSDLIINFLIFFILVHCENQRRIQGGWHDPILPPPPEHFRGWWPSESIESRTQKLLDLQIYYIYYICKV